jgi:predicted MFS family arabinose efflux permease
MIIVDITRAVIIAALAVAILAHSAGLALIYVTAFVTGAGSALRDTAATTSVPRLVTPAYLEQANGRLIAGQIVGNELAGPAAGGWLFGLAAVLPFAVNAGTLGIAVLLLLTLPSVFRPAPRDQGRDQGRDPAERDLPERGIASMRRDLREGFAWLWQHADIRDVTLAAGVVSAMDAAWFAVLVLYVIQILHQRPGAYGLLLAIGALGGIATGGLGARVSLRLGAQRSLLFAGLVMAATQAGLGLTSDVAVAAVMLFASSAAWALFNMTAVTMRQRRVPAELLGRISSLYGAVTRGAEALGAIAGGVLAVAAGIRAPMLAGAVPLFAATVLLAWRHRARPGIAGADSVS